MVNVPCPVEIEAAISSSLEHDPSAAVGLHVAVDEQTSRERLRVDFVDFVCGETRLLESFATSIVIEEPGKSNMMLSISAIRQIRQYQQ